MQANLIRKLRREARSIRRDIERSIGERRLDIVLRRSHYAIRGLDGAITAIRVGKIDLWDSEGMIDHGHG